MMLKRHMIFYFCLVLLLCLSPTKSPAQDQKKSIVSIAVLAYNTQFLSTVDGLEEGLANLGLQKNDNLRIKSFNLREDLSTVPGVIKQLEEQHYDLIVTITTPVALALKAAMNQTNPIPVVFTMVADPLRSGVVASLQRPGSFMTGISYNAFDMIPKRLELFRQAFPELRRIAVFYNQSESWLEQPIRKTLYPAAKDLGFEIIAYDVRSRSDLIAIQKDFNPRIQGIFMVPDPQQISFFDCLVTLSRQHHLPMMVLDNILLEKGGIMGYSPSFASIGHQAATYVYRILAGTPAAELSIQNPDSIQLSISIHEAQSLGIELNPEVLSWADNLLR